MRTGLKSIISMIVLLGIVVPQEQCLQFTAELDRQEIRAGETMTLELSIQINKGFHIYSVHPDMSLSPTEIEHADSTWFSAIGIISEPDPHMKFDPNFDQVIGSHEGSFTLSQQLQLSPEFAPGEYLLEGTLNYLACDATRCIPKWDEFQTELNVLSGEPRTAYISEVPTEYPSAQFEGIVKDGSDTKLTGSGSEVLDEAIEKGFFSFILLAISMGLLSLLTPCVFPMIPITVSFFTHQGESSGGKPIRSATIYALGIIIIYSAVGMLLSVTLGAAGANQIASSPWVNLFIGALFVVFSLSLFGMFELQLPNSLRQYSVKQEQRGGVLGILFMSFTFVITSFTCTVQFVGLLLVAASQGDFIWPLMGMLAYSTAFALPFFFLALFPQYMTKLPRSGGWLNAVKVIMGIVILAASFKFLGNCSALWGWGIFTRQFVLSIWVVLSLVLGFYLLGKIRLPHDSPLEIVSVPRLVISIFSLAFGIYLATGLLGHPLNGTINSFLPHDIPGASTSTIQSTATAEKHQWIDNLDAGFAAAKAQNKPLFVDFTGYTCTNCRWMEDNIFVDPEVQELFGEYVLVHLFTDMGDNARDNQQLKVDRFNTAALPFYVLLTAEDDVIATFPGLDRDVENFIRFLEKGLAWHKAG